MKAGVASTPPSGQPVSAKASRAPRQPVRLISESQEAADARDDPGSSDGLVPGQRRLVVVELEKTDADPEGDAQGVDPRRLDQQPRLAADARLEVPEASDVDVVRSRE